MSVNALVDVGEGRLANHMVWGDPVDANVEGREFVTGIDKRLVGENLMSIAETHDSDLANAADPGARGLGIDPTTSGASIVASDFPMEGTWTADIKLISRNIAGPSDSHSYRQLPGFVPMPATLISPIRWSADMLEGRR
jgi:hypothetical protein